MPPQPSFVSIFLFLLPQGKMERDCSSFMLFYPAFSFLSTSLSPFVSLRSFLPALFQSASSTCLGLFFPFLPLAPTPRPSRFAPGAVVFKVHLFPSLPLISFFVDSSAVSSSATRGPVHARKENVLCYQRRPSMHTNIFQYRKKSGLKIVLVCSVFLLFQMLQETQALCLFVRTCIQNGIITMVLDVSLYNNLSFLKMFFFLADYTHSWATETF